MQPSANTAKVTLIAATIVYPFSILFLYKSFVLLVLFGFSIFVLQGGLRQWKRLMKEPLGLACILLFLFPILTTAWALDSQDTLIRSATMLSTHIPLFILSASLVIAYRGKYIRTGFILSTFVLTATSIFLYIKFGALRADSSAMKDYTGAFSNIAAASVLYSIPFFIGNSLRGQQEKALCIVATICCVSIVFLSLSRSASILLVLAIVVALAFTPIKRSEKSFRAVVILSSITAFLVMLFYLLNSTNILSPIIERLLNSQLLSSSSLLETILNPVRGADDYRRTLMYGSGYQLILDHWIIGAGFGGLKAAMVASYGVGSISHNWVITSLGELGIFGLMNMVIVIILGFRGSLEIYKNDKLPIAFRIIAFQVSLGLLLMLLQGLSRPLYPIPLFSVMLGIFFGITMLPKINLQRARQRDSRGPPRRIRNSRMILR